jgi:hypothetical protein
MKLHIMQFPLSSSPSPSSPLGLNFLSTLFLNTLPLVSENNLHTNSFEFLVYLAALLLTDTTDGF